MAMDSMVNVTLNLASCSNTILNRAFSLTWPASMLIYWNKRKHFHEKRVASQRIFLVHQHGRHFMVLEHQYDRRDVMWKRSVEGYGMQRQRKMKNT